MPKYKVSYQHEEKETDFIVTANGKNEARDKAIDVLSTMNKQGAKIVSINRID